VRAQLYGIAPGDPRTLLIAAAISLATVLAASWLPALRASRVAPSKHCVRNSHLDCVFAAAV
jgi:putative ABC transport system permease protein